MFTADSQFESSLHLTTSFSSDEYQFTNSILIDRLKWIALQKARF